jgi:hypothetical protein
MSDVFIFVLAIVFIGCASGVINNVLRNQRQQRELGGADDSIVAEVSDLRARIEVLEKIVTDEKYHLSREIDRL